jgi:PilZ domain
MDQPNATPVQDSGNATAGTPGDNVQIACDERRGSQRYCTAENQAWTGRWADGTQFVATPAAVVDISLGGARVVMGEPLKVSEKLWIRPANSVKHEFLEATVLEVEPDQTGRYWIRLQFTSPCSHSFLKAVVNGIADASAARSDAATAGQSVQIGRCLKITPPLTLDH